MTTGSLARALYERAPVFAQNLAVSIYGLRLRRREYGRRFDHLLQEFEARERLSATEIEAYQSERFKSIIQHSWDHVPWYRRILSARGLTPGAIQSTGDLQKVPITEASVLLHHHSELISRASRPSDRIRGHTSGTTGRSRTILYDRNVCLIKNVVEWRMRRIAGVDVNDPMANILGHMIVPMSQTKPPFWRSNAASNQLFFSAFHFSPQWYDAYVGALEKFNPCGIDGYPSTVSMFADALRLSGHKIPLRAAFVSSEVLVPWQRTLIEEAFGCPVFDYYGMAERAVFATECEHHTGLHVNPDFGLLELLDENDEPVPAGTSGRVVITGWHNRTMPFIRYKTDDWATMSKEPCPCGRPFPLLSSVDGREADQIATPDGRFLDVSFAYASFDAVQDKIRESQIYQEASGRIALRIVPRPGFGKAEEDRLVAGISVFVGEAAEVEIELRDEIPRTASGKMRWLVSEVPRRLRS